MFILLKNDGTTTYYLAKNTNYTVGRKAGEIMLLDNSVSRIHAIIKVKNRRVFIEDQESANKTHLCGNALTPRVDTEINIGNDVKFGTKDSIFILQKYVVEITHSGLQPQEKEELDKTITTLGGTVRSVYSPSCTHIVVQNLLLTFKVLCGLVNNQLIVTAQYFKDYLKQVEKKGKLPDVTNYQPKVFDDKIKKQLDINYSLDRKRLFKNKVFVFPDDASRKKVADVIKYAGGESVTYDEQRVPKNSLLKTDIEYLFIITKEFSQNNNKEFNDCVDHLMKHKRRSIPVQEIALAILEGNCDMDCNSHFNRIGVLLSAQKHSGIQPSQILAAETQTQASNVSEASSSLLPETENYSRSDTDSMVVDKGSQECDNRKRKSEAIEESDEDSQTMKKQITTNFEKKADDTLQSTQKTTPQETIDLTLKSSLRPNPFYRPKEKKAKTDAENPFDSIRSSITKESKEQIDNPFLRLSKKRARPDPDEPSTSRKVSKTSDAVNILTSTQIEGHHEEPNFLSMLESDASPQKSLKNNVDNKNKIDTKTPTTPLKSLKIEQSDTTKSSHWLGKTIDQSQGFKQTIKSEDCDSQLDEYIKSFVGSVVIKEYTGTISRNAFVDLSVNQTNAACNSTVPNYKKFKKVHVNKQTTIIPKSAMKKFICNVKAVSNVEDVDISSEEEEVPIVNTIHQSGRKTVTRSGRQSEKENGQGFVFQLKF